MKLSIIVPVYNTEKYIRKCIMSIVQQNHDLFQEIELIIVNDGTKDNSINQIQDLIQNNSNISIINQKNEGLSVARNNGIKAAKGDYVWCIDSDDWIRPNALEVLLPLLNEKADLLKIYPVLYTDRGEEYSSIPFHSICSFEGKESFRNNVAQIATSVLLVYRKKYLEDNNLWFMPGVFHEDNEFCPRVCYLSDCTIVVPYHLYIVRRTVLDGRRSITSTINPKRAFDLLKCMESLASFNRDVVNERDIQHEINIWIGQGFNMAIEIAIQSGNEYINKFNSIYFERYRDLICFVKDGMLKNKVEVKLFECFPHHIVQCYKFLSIFNFKRKKKKHID